jgi:hypothetical protein
MIMMWWHEFGFNMDDRLGETYIQITRIILVFDCHSMIIDHLHWLPSEVVRLDPPRSNHSTDPVLQPYSSNFQGLILAVIVRCHRKVPCYLMNKKWTRDLPAPSVPAVCPFLSSKKPNELTIPPTPSLKISARILILCQSKHYGCRSTFTVLESWETHCWCEWPPLIQRNMH